MGRSSERGGLVGIELVTSGQVNESVGLGELEWWSSWMNSELVGCLILMERLGYMCGLV